MKYSILAAATAAAFALAPMSASAITAGSIPGGAATNDGVDDVYGLSPRGGWFGASVYAFGVEEVTVEFFGGEAGFTNSFLWGGTIVNEGASDEFTHTGGSGGPDGTFDEFAALTSVPSATFAVGADGLLPFSFSYNSGAGSVVNGFNPDGSISGTPPNFFATFSDPDDESALFGTAIDLWLDDNGGSEDDNHDDMMVRITATQGQLSVVPVPLGALLIGTAFLGAGAVRRFGRKAA